MPILLKKHKDISREDRYQELVSQGLSVYEAKYITWLEFKSPCSHQENRILQLMYYDSTRRCAEVIVYLEHQRGIYANTLAVLLNVEISEDVRFFIANQCRKNALINNADISWLRQAGSDVEASWYPAQYADIDLYINHMEHKIPKTRHEERLLGLLKDKNTRPSAIEIVSIAFKKNLSQEDRIYLNLLLDPMFRTHAKLIIDKRDVTYDDLLPEEQDILIDYYLHMIVPLNAFGERIQSPHVSLSLLSPRNLMSSLTLLGSTEATIDSHQLKKDTTQLLISQACDEILACYPGIKSACDLMKKQGIDLAASEPYIFYLEKNKHLLMFHLIRYFYRTRQIFSEQELKKLVSTLKEELHAQRAKSLRSLVLVIEQCEVIDILDTSPRDSLSSIKG